MQNTIQLPDNYTNCVEDAILYLGGGRITDFNSFDSISIQAYDHPITRSLATQLDNGLAFTQKQSIIAERLLKKYASALRTVGFDIDKILNEKIYKEPFRVIDKTKSIYIDGEKIVCKSPFIPELVNSFKKRRKVSYERGDYIPDTKEWNFDYNEPNVDFLCKQIKGKNFSVDADVKTAYDKMLKIYKDGINYYPILKYKDKFFVENIVLSQEDNEELSNITDYRIAVLWAKKRGCLAYDDSVVDLYDYQTQYDKIILGDESVVSVDFRRYPMKDLISTIDKTSTTIIFIQSTNKEQLENWIHLLKNNNIDQKDIAVCFRFKKDKEANQFIKDQGVNQYSPNKKVLITNERIPKTFVKDNINPDLIIVDLPTKPAHYKTQIYLENKSLVVYNNVSTKGKI